MAARHMKVAQGSFLKDHPAAVDAALLLTFLSDRSFLYPAAPRERRVMSTSREGDADARPV